MPPFLPRKRLASTPPASPKAGPSKRPRLTDVLDAPPKPALARQFTLGGSESSSSLTDVDSEEFEDVPAKRRKGEKVHVPEEDEEDEEDEDEDVDVDWEDAGAYRDEGTASELPRVTGDIQLTFRKDDDGPDYGTGATTGGRKGPTKREKQVRRQTHMMHVQFLLFHNAIRNMWICDKKVQEILVKQLPGQIMTEVKKWRTASGLVPLKTNLEASPSSSKSKGKGKQKATRERNERDWGQPSQRLEPGNADLSRGDPLISLLKVLSAYWKKRFAITAPGLKKRGYGTKAQLKHDIQSYRNDEHDPARHGERIRNIEEFRERATKCEGSRDVGAQLFTALLRGLGIQSRLVASLQPSGYGWTKAEQMAPRKQSGPKATKAGSDDAGESTPAISKSKGKTVVKSTSKSTPKTRGNKTAPIDLDSDSDANLSECSIIDITPSLPKQRAQLYDRDVPVPIYWTEAISPVTNKVIPCSPLVVATPVVTAPETVAQFEPRGAKADKAKVVMAYVVAYSSDGSAKDVTTRYLKKGVWPGKTRGFRLPVEKIPIYNKHGKVKRYEEYDWFQDAMRGYIRTAGMRTVVDDVEDSSDLVPQRPEKKKGEEGDTLANLKSSPDFVLEQHLRREEALLPGAQPDRMFNPGKGKAELPVYRRDDVVRCLTAESWHKEGRRPKPIEQPLKMVPVRAVTLTRKREAEEHQQRTGEKQMQGLYAEAQTEYIIPPPIQNGVIPKNSYGNMDCFVPSMVPKGAVHIPLKGTVRVCKKLGIDFAEAVTGFEFGNKRAVPVCTGVVVAQENRRLVRDAWTQWAEEQRIKEDAKARQKALDNWRTLVIGLRIREKVLEAYGDDGVDDQEATVENMTGKTAKQPIHLDEDDDEALPRVADAGGGGFLLPHEDDEIPAEDLVMEHHEPVSSKKEAVQYPTPTSLPSTSKVRSRKSLPREQDSDHESLSSAALSTADGSNSEDEDEDEDEVHTSKISVEIPAPKKQRSRPLRSKFVDNDGPNDGKSGSSSSEAQPSGEDNSDDESTSSSEDSDSEEFTTRTHGKRTETTSILKQTKTPTTRSRTPRTVSKTTVVNMSISSTRRAVAKSTATPKRRAQRRDSTLVTSPYFGTK